MADAVQSFRQICWLIFKWLVIATGALAAIAVILFAAAYGYYWYTYDRHVKNVDFIVSTDRKECPEDDYPIYIIIRESFRTHSGVGVAQTFCAAAGPQF